MLKQDLLYGDQPVFTAFDTVTPETPLEQLNLNWREADLPQRLRTKHVHGLHPYLGKFVPQLAEIFLRKYARRAVVDPFVGSGTTLVEANALGLVACGADVSAFNCLLSRVKTQRYDLARLREELEDVLVRLHGALAEGARPASGEPPPDSYLTTWYAPEARRQLLLYRQLMAGYRYRDVMQVILSRAARSARLTTHFELDFPRRPQVGPYYCRKHHRICRPPEQALPFLQRYTADTLARIEAFDRLRTDAPVEVMWGDARTLRFPPCDTVITSPPYPGLIDYHEQHRYAYELLGLPEKREAELGSPARGVGQAAVQAYYQGVEQVFRNVLASLEPGGHVVVVVHDRLRLYERMADALGLQVVAVLERHVNRRTGRRSDEFFEQVYVWRKVS
ncbi:MAG TPA: hypothetical protein VIK73_03890 [Limnochordales bacterium]